MQLVIQLQLMILLARGGGGAGSTFDVQTIGEATRYTISGEGFWCGSNNIT